jgi:hypothetical protein
MESFWLPMTPNRQFKSKPACSSAPRACTTSIRDA